jgi:hypothetical protein
LLLEKNNGELGRDKILIVLEATMRLLFFEIYKRGRYNWQRTWQSPKTILIMVHCQTFRIITCQPPPRGLPLSTTRRCTEQLCGFEPWEPSLDYKHYISSLVLGWYWEKYWPKFLLTYR